MRKKPLLLSSREFNQDVGRAKRAASQGPVIITDRGRPAHVLLSIEEYHRLVEDDSRSLVDLLQMQDDDDFEFEPPRLDGLTRPADLS